MFVMQRLPSLRRLTWTTKWMALAICCLMALSDRFADPLSTMLSSRVIASLGELA